LENVDIFYGQLEYFTDIWDVSGSLGTFCVHLVHFFPVLVSCTKENLAILLTIDIRYLCVFLRLRKGIKMAVKVTIA
jgi:hypothetical protein